MCLHFKGVKAYAKCPRDVVALVNCTAAEQPKKVTRILR